MTTCSRNVRTLRIGSIKHYRSLQYHRGLILEGVRLAAFRNINHLNRTMRKLGLTQLKSETEIRAVQDQMLKDQGMEQDTKNRLLIGCVTWYTWETYLCLLYAEWESYSAASKGDTALVFNPLEKFHKVNKNVIENLKTLRNKLLHPLKAISLEQAVQDFGVAATLSHSFYFSAVVDVQGWMDAYASWLRQSLRELVREETKTGQIANLEWAISVLSYSLPSIVDTPNRDEVQTPIQSILADMFANLLVAMSGTAPLRNEQQAFPAFVRRAKPAMLTLLFRSLVLSNEFTSLLNVEKIRAAKNPVEYDLFHEESQPSTFQQAMNQGALLRVGASLLFEPLRIYRQAVEEAPELRHDGIEEQAGEESVYSALKYFRNVVFHVASDDIDPDDVERKLTDVFDQFEPPELLRHLVAFYLSVG